MHPLDVRLRQVIACHFDPLEGSPYWLRQSFPFDPRQRIQSVADLPLLGPMDMTALQRHSVHDFIPRRFARRPLILAETGGSTGTPKGCAYFPEEFATAFVDSFLAVTSGWPLPDGGHWLYLGPGGPHIIGKAAAHIARRTSPGDGFSVDFDPRWFRRLAAGSVARERYLDHLLEQSWAVLHREPIAALFATQAVLLPLARRLPPPLRERIVFVYLGGMRTDGAQMRQLREGFPRARFCNGYGNTLLGVCHQAVDGDVTGREGFYPFGARLHLRLVRQEDSADPFAPPPPGQPGRVVASRLDESFFLPNLFERDQADAVPPGPAGETGVGHPRPIESPVFKVENGIY